MKRVLLSLCLFVMALGLTLTSAPVPAKAADPILIGGLFAESGKVAGVGAASRLVAEMAVARINEAGGVLGRPLKLVTRDTESDPNKALLHARELVEKEHVLAIVGPTSTGSGMAMKKYIEEKGVPTIMTVGGDPVIAGGKFGPFHWTFKAPQRTSTAVKKIYEYLQAKGVTKIGVLSAKDGFGQDGGRRLNSLAGDYGITVIAEETMDPGDTDFSAQAFKLAAATPQAVVVWTIGPAGAIVSKNFNDLPGEKPLIIQCHGQPGPKFVELAGDAANGVLMPGTKLMVPNALSDSDPQKAVITEFIQDYKARGYHEEFPLNTHSGYAWDAMTLLTEGLKAAGKDDPAALRDALEGLKDVVSVSGVFTMSPEDHNGLDTDSMVMLLIENGEYVKAQ